MKRSIASKIFALSLAFSALLSFSCGDIAEDSENTPAVKTAQSGKAIITVSAERSNARTALPNYAVADFDSFTLKGYKAESGTSYPAEATEEWPFSASTGTPSAYAQLTNFSEEVDVGNWKFTLEGEKSGTKYSGDCEVAVSTDNPNTVLKFTLELSAINQTGMGDVVIKASADGVVAITATIGENTQALSSGSTTFTGLNAGSYIVILKFYEDAAKTLLIGTLSESAIVTGGGTSVSEIALGNLDSSYAIKYYDDNTELTVLTPASYTRFAEATLPVANVVKKDGYVFCGWHTNSALSDEVSTSILKGEVGEKTFYAKWIEEAETKELKKVTVGGEPAVGQTLSAKLWANDEGTEEFAGSVKSYKWYSKTSSETTTDWTAIDNEAGSTYLVKASDGGKLFKVEVVRKYNKVELGVSGNYDVTETSEEASSISGETSTAVAAGTLDKITFSVTDLTYSEVAEVGSTLDASKLSAQNATIKDVNGNEVQVTLGFASGTTAPSGTSAVAITLTAEGYTTAEIENAVTINVKAKKPTDEEGDAYRLSTLLKKEGDGTENSPYTIGKGYIRFDSAVSELEYNVESSTADSWSDVTTEEFVKPSSNKVYVRVKATENVQASDVAEISVVDGNIGKLEKLVKVELPTETETPSVFKYGQTVAAKSYSSEIDSTAESGLKYNELSTGVTYQWYWSATDTSTGTWTAITGATESSFKIEDTLSGTTYTTDLVGKYLKVEATQVNPNDSANPFKVYAISPVVVGALLYSAAGAPSLVYANSESVVVGQTLSVDSITTSDGGALDLTKLAVNTENTAVGTNGVTVALKFAAGVAAPEGKSNVSVTAYAHGYADLEIPVLVTVRAAEPDTAKLGTWLSKDVSAITYGYIKFTDAAAAAHLQYATAASPEESDWADVEANEVLKGDKLWLRVKEYKATGETDRSYGSDETLEVIASSAVDLTSSAYSSTYTGTRSIKVISVTGDNAELALAANGLTITATPSKAGDTITRWEVDGVTVSGDWTLYGNSSIASVSTTTNTNDTLTFDSSKITKTNGVTTARYQVTVYGTRTTTNGSVTLTTTLTVDVPLSSDSGN